MMLSKLNITYVLQKAIKGQAIADFLADGLTDESSSLKFDFPNKYILCVKVELNKIVRCKMCFNGAANQLGCGIGVVLISPIRALILITVGLSFP